MSFDITEETHAHGRALAGAGDLLLQARRELRGRRADPLPYTLATHLVTTLPNNFSFALGLNLCKICTSCLFCYFMLFVNVRDMLGYHRSVAAEELSYLLFRKPNRTILNQSIYSPDKPQRTRQSETEGKLEPPTQKTPGRRPC